MSQYSYILIRKILLDQLIIDKIIKILIPYTLTHSYQLSRLNQFEFHMNFRKLKSTIQVLNQSKGITRRQSRLVDQVKQRKW